MKVSIIKVVEGVSMWLVEMRLNIVMNVVMVFVIKRKFLMIDKRVFFFRMILILFL